MIPVHFHLDGRVPVKKNNRRILKVHRKPHVQAGTRMSSADFAGTIAASRGKYKTIVAPSEQYTAWERWAVWELRKQALDKNLKIPIPGPLNVAVSIGVTDRRRCDTLNLMAGPMDALTESGIIEDDCWTVVPTHDGSEVRLSDSPFVHITITSAREPK